MLGTDSFGFAISWGTAVPELTEVFQSSGTKAAAELGLIQVPATLHGNV